MAKVQCRTSRNAVFVLLFVNAVLLALSISGTAPGLPAEYGILETLQLFLAVGAGCVVAFAAFEDEGAVGTPGSALASIAAIAALRHCRLVTHHKEPSAGGAVALKAGSNAGGRSLIQWCRQVVRAASRHR